MNIMLSPHIVINILHKEDAGMFYTWALFTHMKTHHQCLNKLLPTYTHLKQTTLITLKKGDFSFCQNVFISWMLKMHWNAPVCWKGLRPSKIRLVYLFFSHNADDLYFKLVTNSKMDVFCVVWPITKKTRNIKCSYILLSIKVLLNDWYLLR